MVVYTLEQRCQILRHYFCRFWQKKIILSDEAHLDLGGYVNKQNCRMYGTENPHRKRVTVWCGFWFIFLRKWARRGRYSQWRLLSGHVELKRRMLETFDFNRMALRATQPKLHSMFCALFLKIALSATELLMSFGNLRPAIWHRWTIIFGGGRQR